MPVDLVLGHLILQDPYLIRRMDKQINFLHQTLVFSFESVALFLQSIDLLLGVVINLMLLTVLEMIFHLLCLFHLLQLSSEFLDNYVLLDDLLMVGLYHFVL